MKYIIYNIVCILLINCLLYLAINIHQIFSYILISFLFVLLSFVFKRIFNSQIHSNAKNNNFEHKSAIETAEDHPIIKSARKRLGK